MKETDPYLETFERFEAQAKQPAWVFPLRKAGIARFAELGFPTLQQEDWRFTNVAPDRQTALQAGLPGVARRPDPGSCCRNSPSAGWPPAAWCSSTAITRRSCLRPGRSRRAWSSAAWPRRWRAIRGWSKEHLARYPQGEDNPLRRSTRPSSRTAALSMCRGQAAGGADPSAVHLDGEGGRGHVASAQPDHRRKGQPGDGARKLRQHRRGALFHERGDRTGAGRRRGGGARANSRTRAGAPFTWRPSTPNWGGAAT